MEGYGQETRDVLLEKKLHTSQSRFKPGPDFTIPIDVLQKFPSAIKTQFKVEITSDRPAENVEFCVTAPSSVLFLGPPHYGNSEAVVTLMAIKSSRLSVGFGDCLVVKHINRNQTLILLYDGLTKNETSENFVINAQGFKLNGGVLVYPNVAPTGHKELASFGRTKLVRHHGLALRTPVAKQMNVHRDHEGEYGQLNAASSTIDSKQGLDLLASTHPQDLREGYKPTAFYSGNKVDERLLQWDSRAAFWLPPKTNVSVGSISFTNVVRATAPPVTGIGNSNVTGVVTNIGTGTASALTVIGNLSGSANSIPIIISNSSVTGNLADNTVATNSPFTAIGSGSTTNSGVAIMISDSSLTGKLADNIFVPNSVVLSLGTNSHASIGSVLDSTFNGVVTDVTTASNSVALDAWADALPYGQSNAHFFSDNRLRNAYQGGDIALSPGWLLSNTTNAVRMPGWYDPANDLATITNQTTAFWHTTFDCQKESLPVLGDSSTFDISKLDADKTLAQALGEQLAMNPSPTFNRLSATTDPNSSITSLSYDTHNRLLSATDPNGNITNFSYDANGNIIKVTDALGNETNYEYDANNNLVDIIDSLGRVTNYSHDLAELLKPIEVDYSYDSAGRRTSVVDADKTTSFTYAYDAVGDVVQLATPDQGKTIYHYDSVNREVHTTYSDAANFAYNYALIDYAHNHFAQTGRSNAKNPAALSTGTGLQVDVINSGGAQFAVVSTAKDVVESESPLTVAVLNSGGAHLSISSTQQSWKSAWSEPMRYEWRNIVWWVRRHLYASDA